MSLEIVVAVGLAVGMLFFLGEEARATFVGFVPGIILVVVFLLLFARAILKRTRV